MYHYQQLKNTCSEIIFSNSSSIQKSNSKTLLQELQFARNQIEAMESSKFWKIRSKWLILKQFLRSAINK